MANDIYNFIFKYKFIPQIINIIVCSVQDWGVFNASHLDVNLFKFILNVNVMFCSVEDWRISWVVFYIIIFILFIIIVIIILITTIIIIIIIFMLLSVLLLEALGAKGTYGGWALILL